MEDFPWTYDQLQRYSVLREYLEVFYPEGGESVLDVGGVSPDREGLSVWLPVKHVTRGKAGVCFALDRTVCRKGGFIRGDGMRLPFKSRSFDVVAALDVLEHVSQAGREEFLGELCRVARGSVIVSAPFRDRRVEEVEGLLFEQVKRLYGVEHGQLLEHRTRGLPECSSVSLALGRHMKSGLSFGYGSLANWLFLQSVKNVFMFRRNAGRIQELLDKWMTYRARESEFEQPHSRFFWIYSKDIGQADLEEGVLAVKKNLRERRWVECGFEEVAGLNREIVDFFARERVSAVVVASGKGKHIVECLNHLLTQRVDFDLEVVIWDIGRDAAKEKAVKARFPGIKYRVPELRERASGGLLRMASELLGDYILLVSEDILLPLDSVKLFVERMKAEGAVGGEGMILTPRVVWKRYFTPVCGGGKFSPKILAAGRLVSPFHGFRAERARWVYSECLFFRKDALFERKFNGRRLSRRNVFLWKKWGRSPVLYLADHTVHKRQGK
jgi:hypothetical protein